jgi:hypothetical protein
VDVRAGDRASWAEPPGEQGARSRLTRVTLFRGIGRARGGSAPRAGAVAAHEQKRQTSRSLVGAGTLACSRCDAPIAIGADPVLLTDLLACPFCLHQGPARDFLSLASPTRPARVIVRVLIP